MNFFKNLPSDVLMNIYSFDDTYKKIFTEKIINSEILRRKVQQRFINKIADKNIKILYRFIRGILTDYDYEIYELSDFSYVQCLDFYKIYFNNKLIYEVFIINKNQLKKINCRFNFCLKCNDHYLITWNATSCLCGNSDLHKAENSYEEEEYYNLYENGDGGANHYPDDYFRNFKFIINYTNTELYNRFFREEYNYISRH